jgi:hypothetical protein
MESDQSPVIRRSTVEIVLEFQRPVSILTQQSNCTYFEKEVNCYLEVGESGEARGYHSPYIVADCVKL